LRLDGTRYRRESNGARGQMQKSTAQKFCCFNPERSAPGKLAENRR
jgi:hypothetical protein